MRTIEEIKAEYEKVKSMIPKGYTNTDLCELEYELRNALIFNIPLDRLQEICNAERDGRLMVLPCKVGDTVYHDSGGFGILDYVIEGFSCNETGIIFQAASDSFGVDDVWECLDEIEFYGSDIGKTVFLTREEAEKALKERDQE